tara:strand:- start:4511 stop:5209 length:699 start_codon:yes stop_codon:yes gene_type:complete
MALARQKQKSKRIRKVAAASKPKKKRKSWIGKYRGIDLVQKLRRKKLGIKPKEKAGRVGAKAKKAVKTKGGTYVKYKKKSASAKSFRSTFASSCKGKGSGDAFSWQGRSYSCARASDKKKAVTKDSPKKVSTSKIPKKKMPPKKVNSKASYKKVKAWNQSQKKKKINRKVVKRKTVNVSSKVPKKIMKDLRSRAAAKASSSQSPKDYRTTNYKKDRTAAIASIKARRKKARV